MYNLGCRVLWLQNFRMAIGRGARRGGCGGAATRARSVCSPRGFAMTGACWSATAVGCGELLSGDGRASFGRRDVISCLLARAFKSKLVWTFAHALTCARTHPRTSARTHARTHPTSHVPEPHGSERVARAALGSWGFKISNRKRRK